METGFNIVEVPGSKSRKVAGKKQQWYRTAIWKMFLQSNNLLQFSAFLENVTTNYNVLDSKLFPELFVRSGLGNILISPRDSKMESVFSFKLQKTVRFFFFGNAILLVKSYFSSLFNVLKIDCAYLVFPDRRAINLKNR